MSIGIGICLLLLYFRVAPTVKSVDSVDSRLKPAAAPVSAPVAAAPISTPAKTVKEEAKPVPPKPAPALAKPANLFSALQYSKNLVCPNAQVKVQFMWNPLTFQVVADADEGPLAEFQAEVGIYATKGKLELNLYEICRKKLQTVVV